VSVARSWPRPQHLISGHRGTTPAVRVLPSTRGVLPPESNGAGSRTVRTSLQRIGDAGPLLGISVVCLIVGLDFRASGGPVLGGRLAVWGLFVALGIIAGVGGGISYAIPESGSAAIRRRGARAKVTDEARRDTVLAESARRSHSNWGPRGSPAGSDPFLAADPSTFPLDALSPEAIWNESPDRDDPSTARGPDVEEGEPASAPQVPPGALGPAMMHELDDLLDELDRMRVGRRRTTPG